VLAKEIHKMMEVDLEIMDSIKMEDIYKIILMVHKIIVALMIVINLKKINIMQKIHQIDKNLNNIKLNHFSKHL